MDYKEFHEKIFAPLHEPPRAGYVARIRQKLSLERQDAVFRFLEDGERFLDVGCGYGKLVFQATQKYDQVYGTDITEERIAWNQEAAKNINNASVQFRVADWNQPIPFEDGYFDTVSCVASFEFSIDPIQLLKEFHRVLKPGGQLVLFISNIAYVSYRIRALLGNPPQISHRSSLVDAGVLRYFTLNSLTRLLHSEGFSVIRTGNAGSLWFLRNWWKSLLASGLVIKAVKTA